MSHSPYYSIRASVALPLFVFVFGAVSPMRASAQERIADSADVAGLPIREIPATTVGPGSDVLVIFLTGDGGWAAIDKDIAAVLAGHGAAVVGLDTRSYLSRKRTPDEVGRDVARIARHYLPLWKRARLVLVGYSRGADLAPFAANRLPTKLRQRLVLVAMLGLAPAVGFEMHWRDLVQDVHRPSDVPTVPEVERLRGTRMLCIYGTEEPRSACRDAPVGLMRVVARQGKHHFDNDYRGLGELVWSAVP